jgi:hypothetical protein
MTRQLIIDYGGNVYQHMAMGQHYKEIGAYLAIKYCASACFWMLALVPIDHVCVYPDAWFGYHTGAQRGDGIEFTQTMMWRRGWELIDSGKYKPC